MIVGGLNVQCGLLAIEEAQLVNPPRYFRLAGELPQNLICQCVATPWGANWRVGEISFTLKKTLKTPLN
jgi:hypothetical protein